jgi:colanic acid biosynthesis glycosyl transferase WcaI
VTDGFGQTGGMSDHRPAVLLITQWYSPEPVQQPAWIAHALTTQGLDVDVLTGVPNYPTGEVSSGHSALRPEAEVIDGVRVRRAPLYPSHSHSAGKRMLNYLSWAFSAAVVGRRHLRRADATLVYSSPATAAIPAMAGRRLFGTPYVLLVQDVWPDSIFASGFLPGRVGRVAHLALSAFADLAYRWADTVVVISPGMVDLLAERGVPREKLELVYNWMPEPSDVQETPPDSWRERLGISREDFVLLYAGNHGAAQALGPVLEAFSLMREDRSVHLVLAGDGVDKPKLIDQAASAGLTNVHFVDRQPFSAMASLSAAADAQLISLADRPLFDVTMPSKVQAVLAAARPAVVSARGDAARVVVEAGAGVAVDPESPEALAAALRRLRDLPTDAREEMGHRGRSYYDSNMAERVGGERLARALVRAAGRPRRDEVDHRTKDAQ